jgi:hypothetical protein
MCVPNYKKPQLNFFKNLSTISKERNTNKWWFLLSFTQSSIWKSNFLNNGFTPTILFTSFNAFKQWEFPYTIGWKNAFWGSNSNKTCDSLISSFLRLEYKHKSDLIVKLRSLGQSSLKHWTKVLSPWPWIIILVNVTCNCPNLDTIFFFIWSWRKVVLEWFILSWIIHKNLL